MRRATEATVGAGMRQTLKRAINPPIALCQSCSVGQGAPKIALAVLKNRRGPSQRSPRRRHVLHVSQRQPVLETATAQNGCTSSCSTGTLKAATCQAVCEHWWKVQDPHARSGDGQLYGETFCNWSPKPTTKSRYASACPVHAHGEKLGKETERISSISLVAFGQHSVSPPTVLPDFAPHNPTLTSLS